jgi:diguanylate cyclase (GGDEF)-like protein
MMSGLRRWRRSWRSPVVSTRRAMALTAAVACAVGGAVGLVASIVPPDNPTDAGLRGASLLSVVAGALFAAFGSRLPHAAFYALAEISSLLLGASLCLQRTRPEVSAIASLFLLITVFLFAFFDPIAGLPGLATVLATLILVKVWWSTLTWATVVVLVGMNILIAAIVAWLVRAAADADRDGVTGLLNWRGLDRTIRAALGHTQRRAQAVTVALLSIDDFERITERHGNAEGERLLRSFGQAWATHVRPPAVIGRSSGDEFLLAVPAASSTSITELMDTLRTAAPTSCTFSAGVAASTAGDTNRTLFTRADAAARKAKREGGNRTVYARNADADARTLADGLDAGEFHVAYQPIVDVRTGRVAGAEALLRWTRPGHGAVSPDEFIPLAERCGFINRLGRWVLETACRDAAAWPRTVPAKITVNVSGSEMQQDGYADQVLGILAATGLPAERLVLEVTESTLQADSSTAIDALAKLRGHGVRIAIDDFGTGYSSLSRLQHLPADILKIDQSFVAALRPTDQSAPLIAAITALAHAMGLRTVAEGVEEHYQAELLAYHGCDEAQGWLHGRPDNPELIADALATPAPEPAPLTARPVPGTRP